MDHLLLDSFCVCLPSFPARQPGESDAPAGLPRNLPAYTGPELSRHPSSSSVFGVSAGAPLPRVLPLKPEGYAVQPPPYYPDDKDSSARVSSLEVKPLRLVRASRKRKNKKPPPRKQSPPPSYYATCSYTLYQSVTTLSIEPADSPPPPTYFETMASQASTTAPKVGTETGPRPFGPGGNPPRAVDNVLADLHRGFDDSASESGSSVDSRGVRRRRRRRRNNNNQIAPSGGIQTGPVLPRLAETKPVRLQLGLNLDVELELKARLQGDVSLTLL